jgi:hypothetical protein
MTFFINCASYISECDEAIKLHQQAKNEIGEKREDLEAKANALEMICAKKREQEVEDSKKEDIERNPNLKR